MLLTVYDLLYVVITPPSGRGLVIPFFFRGCFFFGGHLPQTSGFRSAKEILVVSFATQPRAFILSDRNIFYTRGRTTAGSNAPGAFLVTPPSGRGLVIPIFFLWFLPRRQDGV